MIEDALPGELLARVESLTAQVDELPDAHARELAHELVGTVIAMYGDGLQRIMDAIGRSRQAAATILDELAEDGAVASLLLIHDLYPVSLEERVVEALDTVRPYMESHGGNVELLGIEDGIARLALQGSCNGCAASRATLELAIKQALDEHAPDLAGIAVDGIDPEPTGKEALELPVIHTNGEPPLADERPPSWMPVELNAHLSPGEIRSLAVDGTEIVLANVDGTLLAYRDECASCGAPLAGGTLYGGMLGCARCGVEFDLPRAGRAAGGEPLQLRPVPLLEAGGLRVAV